MFDVRRSLRARDALLRGVFKTSLGPRGTDGSLIISS